MFMQPFKREKIKEESAYMDVLLLYTYMSWTFFLFSQTTTQLYLAISCLPWTLVTLCGDISVTFIMSLLDQTVSHVDTQANLTMC